ncbi:oxygen-dependent coproporphyrinogen oxidase [Coxiella burnetii]|uniref:oxygen-dependent coproporphyrinogen oxidase n=1 Tax=Coxiella burnetii TaxID=777 RepID=UPI0009B8632F|nr:oxygen-dependent coproporphyrinogen oxidase [Coxiella burnetii]
MEKRNSMRKDRQNKITEVGIYLKDLQNRLCRAFEKEEGESRFQETLWEKPNGGGGRTRLLTEGHVIEQGGVNFSCVYGNQLPPAATQKHPEISGFDFQAEGLSLVIHPRNPYVPSVHANFRFFIAGKDEADPRWWFGGGYDLTPYYGFEEDCRHWHRVAKKACDRFGEAIYPRFKAACDDYFYLKHRNEPRGIGGLFFDDLNEWEFKRCFEFIKILGDSFLEAYLPIMQNRKNHPYGERQREFQLYRRGRYVEFNLLYDRGTRFGLEFGGRTESILMSLPPRVVWRPNWEPEPGSEEARLYEDYLVRRNWVSVSGA